MRIITGDYKGRRLESPADNRIRPTTDKVKEAIFSMIVTDTYGRVFADIFAGTGNLGIEALSRGADKCYFGDNSRESINLIKRNVLHCGAEDKSVILAGNYEKVIRRIPEKVDVFFLDPPYKEGLMMNCINTILEEDKIAPDGLIIAEHSKTEDLPDKVGSLEKIKERKYGYIQVTIYRNF